MSNPVIDPQNPLYCPSIPASSYLLAIKRQLRSRKQRSLTRDGFVSFPRILQQELFGNSPGTRYPYFPPGLGLDSSGSSLESALSPGNSSLPRREKESRLSVGHEVYSASHSDVFAKHKGNYLDDQLFNETREPLKFLTFPAGEDSQSPLDLTAQHGCPPYVPRFDWSDGDRAQRKDQICDLAGVAGGADALIFHLDALFPGIRLAGRLLALNPLTYQSIVDVLAEIGLLNYYVLNLFRSTDVVHLFLSASMIEQDGLNLAGRDLLHAFKQPNSFPSLREIELTGTPLADFSLVCIHHLPRLSLLLLDNTGISNEAIFHLTSLKQTLQHLSIASNPLVDNDAVPALLVLVNLSFLSILATGITMPGLRRLAVAIHQDDRAIDIQIPIACEQHIDNMHRYYKVDLQPPLVSDPSVVDELSLSALKRNLTAHAACNDAIGTNGTKRELAERLKRTLSVRQIDMLVRGMICGASETRDAESTDEGEN